MDVQTAVPLHQKIGVAYMQSLSEMRWHKLLKFHFSL